MSDGDRPQGRLDQAALERILETTRRLARPIDLPTMLGEVIDVARDVLDSDRGTVFLYEAETDQLVVSVGTDLEPIRLPADRGIVGECIQQRRIINVPDCYADERFNRDVDRKTGYRTRCLLTVPLIGHDDSLVGALQILNKNDGTFDAYDENVAEVLGAQCAVALQRARMIEAQVAKERMDRELALARDIQAGFLPREMPTLAGYELAGTSEPASEAGGDTFDLIQRPDGSVLMLVGDATGHGVGPALSATQVRAMLRVAARLGADVEDTLRHINDQLESDLASNLFVTGFVGTVEPDRHRLHYHSAGQAPILHFKAETDESVWLGPTAPPLGLMSPLLLKHPIEIDLSVGDVVAVMTDGVFESEDGKGNQFGEAGVAELMVREKGRPLSELIAAMHRSLTAHRRGVPADDDVTIVLVRRGA